MIITYSNHAKKQIAERRIERQWIEDAILRPDVTRRNGIKTYAIKRINSHTLKAVYVKKKYIKVVTCYFIK